MTYRLDMQSEGGWAVMSFQGVLDRAALAVIRAWSHDLLVHGMPVRLILLPRTEVESDCIRELARLEGVAVVAQEQFLGRALDSSR
jgi:hypothetical protein